MVVKIMNNLAPYLNGKKRIKYIDLFAGIGGFRIAITSAANECGWTPECVFTSEIDTECQKAY